MFFFLKKSKPPTLHRAYHTGKQPPSRIPPISGSAAAARHRYDGRCENGVRLLRPPPPVLILSAHPRKAPRRRRLVPGCPTVAEIRQESCSLLLFITDVATANGCGGGDEAPGAERGRQGGTDRGGPSGLAGRPGGPGVEGVEAPGGGHALC